MGASGKRFMKFREVRDVLTTTDPYTTITIYNNPSDTLEYKTMATLFSRMKVCAMKVHWIPFGNVQINEIAGGERLEYQPMIVWYDQDNIATTVTSANVILQNESAVVKNSLRPWKYYKKLQRSTKGADTDMKGYQQSDPDKVLSSQMIRVFLQYINNPAAGSNLGKLIITWYCVFKARE